ncbi:sulfotransferase [Acidithiobacillus montserratensis]|uniref:Sulfotransferase n=1 Tax=Acidithiobacillus montserratensis TaxID=2729135 RepID=A0ACD5HHW0_9PROT|nr:sulfotransferase [Acidithiobacillus montserratensis]MBU2748229.1 sulfotransferase [Acidithiobacillus montserratensis]
MSDFIWPNFYIVGAVKSGTTSLYAYLKQHPQVFLPETKEPHYFTRVKPAPEQDHLIQRVSSQQAYQHLYRGSEKFSCVGDASPSYLWCPEAAERIYQVRPDARIIVILRDPVQRAYAQYLMDHSEGVIDLPFLEALKKDWTRPAKGWGISQLYLELGQYAGQIARYQQRFGTENVLVCLLEDLHKNPEQTLMVITRFLGIDSQAIHTMDLQSIHNAYRLPRGNWARRLASHPLSRRIGEHFFPRRWGDYIWRHYFLMESPKPPMDPEARQFLQTFYEPEIQQLEQLLGRALPELRKSWKIDTQTVP